MKNRCLNNTRVFTAALFTVNKRWKWPRCPSFVFGSWLVSGSCYMKIWDLQAPGWQSVCGDAQGTRNQGKVYPDQGRAGHPPVSCSLQGRLSWVDGGQGYLHSRSYLGFLPSSVLSAKYLLAKWVCGMNPWSLCPPELSTQTHLCSADELCLRVKGHLEPRENPPRWRNGLAPPPGEITLRLGKEDGLPQSH